MLGPQTLVHQLTIMESDRWPVTDRGMYRRLHRRCGEVIQLLVFQTKSVDGSYGWRSLVERVAI